MVPPEDAPMHERDARVHGEVEHAVDAAQRYGERLRLLADAGARLSASLELEPTLHAVAGIALPALGDFGFFDLVEDDGQVRRIARAHDDPELEALLAETRWARADRQSCDRADLNPCALSSGRAALHADVDDAWLEQVAAGPEHLARMRTLAFRSMITVPLELRGRTIGALTLFHGRSGRRHTTDDLELAAELSRRAAVAVDNARLYAAAREASRLKDEFLGVVSHELRTPLTAILGWAKLLESGARDAGTITRAAQAIVRNADAQVRIIDDILDASRIITGKLELQRSEVDLQSVAALAVEGLRPAAEARRITLTLSQPAPLPALLGDPARLQQVMSNLLSNAIKFTKPGGHVEVRLLAEPDAARVEVADDGIGIHPDFLPHVFDRFRQADGSSTRAHGGVGLGLSLVRHLVELHGGAVHARSAGPDQGATFSVVLPARLAATPARAEASAAPVRLDGLEVLVVDDDDETREMLAAVLDDLGARVLLARNAAEALAVLDVATPSVLVSDIGMPESDGYALLRGIRARGGRASTLPAVALTAYAGVEDRRRALDAGFAAHVAKPVDPALLGATLARLRRASP